MSAQGRGNYLGTDDALDAEPGGLAQDRADTPLRTGDVLYGFCGGCFGRDSYGNKRVEAIGTDWVIARDGDGDVAFYGGDPERLREYRQPDDGWR